MYNIIIFYIYIYIYIVLFSLCPCPAFPGFPCWHICHVVLCCDPYMCHIDELLGITKILILYLQHPGIKKWLKKVLKFRSQ